MIMATLLVVSCGSSGGGGDASGTMVTFDLAGLDSASSYFWKVRTVDALDATTESTVRTFNTE